MGGQRGVKSVRGGGVEWRVLGVEGVRSSWVLDEECCGWGSVEGGAEDILGILLR